MFNISKIKKLITKSAKINGASFPPTEDKPATDILFTIEGYIAFKISSYDTEIVAKLIEVGAMELDYSFKNKSDLSSLFNVHSYDVEPFELTKVTVTEAKKQISILQGKEYVSFIDKDFTDCFTGGNFFGQAKQRGVIFHIENDKTKGVIMPFKTDSIGVIQEIASKTTPTVTIKEGDDHFGYCSNCQRAEKIRTWHDYKFCPCCGHKIERR